MNTPRAWSLLAGLAALLAGPGPAAEPAFSAVLVEQRFVKGQQFARDEFPAQALREFLWCFDEGMRAFPQFKGVRTGLLVEEIKKLADTYEPAQQAMMKRCDEAERRLLAGDPTAGVEFAAWCDALNDPKRLLRFFDQLPPDDPRRHGLGLQAFRIFLEKHRYADAVSALPYDAMTRLADTQIERVANSPQASPESRDFVTSSLLDYIEALAGASRSTEADEMIAKLKQFDPSGSTRREIDKRLKRAAETPR